MSPAGFLQIQNIVKEFGGAPAVNDVSIDIAKGEVFALLGSSGCGKTTLLRMLAGFETPTSGRIVLDGRDLAGLAPFERPLNMMFQSYALFPHLSVADNVAFGLQREGLPPAVVAQRVDAMLQLVQLSAFAKRKPHQLSGGQQQRVALARSLAKKPQLLLLDEPLGSLDKKLREETQIELANIIADVGVTCVMVTHDQEEAMTMATRIAVMSEGRFLQVGPPDEIYERPATTFVADFIGNVNLIAGSVVSHDGADTLIDSPVGRIQVAGTTAVYDGAVVTVAIRPEKIQLAGGAPVAERSVNAVHGAVKDIAYFGSYTVYHLALANELVMKVSQSNVDRAALPFARGDGVWASWLPSAPIVLAA